MRTGAVQSWQGAAVEHGVPLHRLSADDRSAFSLSVLVSAAEFLVTTGEPVIGGLHGPTRHFYCPHCKSWMFTRPDGADHLVNVRTPMLDTPEGFAPYLETFTREKLDWVTTPAVRSFDGFPELADYPGLMQGYRERVG